MSSSHFRQQRATDLYRLAVALRKSQIRCELNDFDSAVSQSIDSYNGGDTWGYSTGEVIFKRPDQPTEIVPQGASLSRIALSVTLEGICDIGEQGDPLNDLGVNLKLIAGGGDSKKMKLFWYMDRSESKEGRLKLPVHPRYHFQFGGLRAKKMDTGEVVLPSTPRIAHPPLDFCLSVDFVLSNFFKEEWVELRKKGDHYYGIIRDSQRLFWKPYADASNIGWDRVSDHPPWQVVQVWPQLIPEDGIDDLHD